MDLIMLPLDCLWAITQHLSVRDLALLAQTCRHVAGAIDAEPVWAYQYRVHTRHVQGMRIPRSRQVPVSTDDDPSVACSTHASIFFARWKQRLCDAMRPLMVTFYIMETSLMANAHCCASVSCDRACRVHSESIPPPLRGMILGQASYARRLRLRRHECDSRRLAWLLATLLNVPLYGFDLWSAFPAVDDDRDSSGMDADECAKCWHDPMWVALGERLCSARSRDTVPAPSMLSRWVRASPLLRANDGADFDRMCVAVVMASDAPRYESLALHQSLSIVPSETTAC